MIVVHEKRLVDTLAQQDARWSFRGHRRVNLDAGPAAVLASGLLSGVPLQEECMNSAGIDGCACGVPLHGQCARLVEVLVVFVVTEIGLSL